VNDAASGGPLDASHQLHERCFASPRGPKQNVERAVGENNIRRINIGLGTLALGDSCKFKWHVSIVQGYKMQSNKPSPEKPGPA
jgi:hypothetical protein